MADKDEISSKLPPGTAETAHAVWDRLSAADRRAIQEVIEAFPSQGNLINLLLKLASGQMKMAFGNKHRVAIVGPTNVGKSTLYNQLVRRKEDRAEVSPLPGTTRQNQQADAGLFAIVDTPGADATGESGASEQEQAITAAAGADFLIIMFDGIQGIKRTELEIYERLAAMKKPFVIVMNKIDLVRKERQRVIEGAAETLHLQPDQIIPIVAKTGENMDDVLIAIALTEPGIVAALGQAMPQYRWQLAWRSIVSAASASAVIALTPLPVIDFIPLVATQSVMVLGIARIYNYQITLERAREIVATFGMGLLGRMLFQELSRLGGIPGWVLGAAVASSTTVVMGYAAAVWFDTGERISNERLKQIAGEVTQNLLNVLKNLGKRRPNKQSLKEQIEQTLQDMPIGQDRARIDPASNDDTNSSGPKEAP
jgi:small GTP-binding protein